MASELIHRSKLDIDTATEGYRKTSIAATLGPACNDEDTILEMIKSGMNIARLNLSHSTHKEHAEVIKMIRSINLSLPPPFLQVAIALDLRGPEIRTGSFAGGNSSVTFTKGDKVTVSVNEVNKEKQTASLICVDYPDIINQTDIGSRIVLDDGTPSMIVLDKGFDFLECQVDNGGVLGINKGVYLPGIRLNLPYVSEQDEVDIQFAIKYRADMILASSTSHGNDIKRLREVMGEEGKKIQILAKIENHIGIENISSIIEEADGVFVARGDLGIEIAPEKVFLAQKMIISKCNMAGKPVLCGTQMLESMTRKPRPTRAEAGDVANAVIDGVDCVMLSGETALGNFPVECIQVMDRICKEAECSLHYKTMFEELRRSAIRSKMDRIAAAAVSAVEASFGVNAVAIITLTVTGASAAYIAQFRPQCVTMAVTRLAQSARQMHLNRGVMPIFYPYDWDPNGALSWMEDVENRVNYAIQFGKQCNLIKKNDYVVITTGWKEGSGHMNTVRVHKV